MISCGMGLDAATCYAVNHSIWKERLNHMKIGKISYLLHGLKQVVIHDINPMKVTLDDGTVHYLKDLFIIGMNTKYEGGGVMFCPQAMPNDRCLDVCAVEDLSVEELMSLIPAVFKGTHVNKPKIWVDRFKEMEIRAEHPFFVHTDGEVSYKSTHIKMALDPDKLTLLN